MHYITLPLAFVSMLLHPTLTQAYIGPGAGLGAIGTAIAFLIAILLLIVGFIWYPIKRFLRHRNSLKSPSNKR